MADKVTLTTLKQRKTDGRPIAMATCYDFASAVLAQRSGMDSILVGDSLAQVILGHETTLPATMEIMLAKVKNSQVKKTQGTVTGLTEMRSDL